MMKVAGIKSKFDCMIFQMQFESRLRGLLKEITSIQSACTCLRKSPKFKRILAVVLTLGNEINSGGSSENIASAFKLETLLKLNEVRQILKLFFFMEKNVITFLILFYHLHTFQGQSFRQKNKYTSLLGKVSEDERKKSFNV